jgi:hypothetical protein
MLLSKQFYTIGKNIRIVNGAKELIRLNSIKQNSNSNKLVTSEIIPGYHKELTLNVSKSWTISNKNNVPFVWLNIPNNNMITYQIRLPYKVNLLSLKHVEFKIFIDHNLWYSSDLPTNCTAEWERSLLVNRDNIDPGNEHLI